jgi:N-dimethylarginine dimethylaminohydrolase
VRNGKVLLASFRYPQRRRETLYYREWFREHGFTLQSLTNVSSFEGGDALHFDNVLLVGTGFRANVASCEEVAEKLNFDVVPLQLIDPAFYHLDMCFLPLDNTTAFYYPAAFSENSQRQLRRLVRDLHELSEDEAKGFSANSFVSNNTVIVQAGEPTSFCKKLQDLGRKVVLVDISEFNKGGGGIHCLILPLEWEAS